MVLAQRVVHVRADRQGLVTWSVALGYSPAPARPLRATLGVRVSTPYGAVTHSRRAPPAGAPRGIASPHSAQTRHGAWTGPRSVSHPARAQNSVHQRRMA